MIYHEGQEIGHFPYLPGTKGMVMLSEQAIEDKDVLPQRHGPAMGTGSGPAPGSNLPGDRPKEKRMSIQQIQQKMESLKLNHTLPLISELFEEATKQKSSALDFFEKLLTLEVEAREESRIAASLKVSGLPKGMHLDNFDFLFQPSVDKAKIDHLSHL